MPRAVHFVLAAALIAPVLFAQTDSHIQSAVQKTLHHNAFRNLQPSVENRIVTVNGSVDLYSVKMAALHKIARIEGIQAIRDEIQVAGPRIADAALQADLANRLQLNKHHAYVQVKNGVVTLGGKADSIYHTFAIATIAQTKGVRGFHDALAGGNSSLLNNTWLDHTWPGTGLSSQ